MRELTDSQASACSRADVTRTPRRSLRRPRQNPTQNTNVLPINMKFWNFETTDDALLTLSGLSTLGYGAQVLPRNSFHETAYLRRSSLPSARPLHKKLIYTSTWVDWSCALG